MKIQPPTSVEEGVKIVKQVGVGGANENRDGSKDPSEAKRLPPVRLELTAFRL